MPEDERLSSEELIEMIREGALFGAGTTLQGEEMIAVIGELLETYAASDFVTVMHSEPAVQEFAGIDGFREAIRDWISPYESFRFIVEDVIVAEDSLVFLVRQHATTKHGGVDVGTESGAVWRIRAGRGAPGTFYLDRANALKAAGLDPGRPPGE